MYLHISIKNYVKIPLNKCGKNIKRNIYRERERGRDACAATRTPDRHYSEFYAEVAGTGVLLSHLYPTSLSVNQWKVVTGELVDARTVRSLRLILCFASPESRVSPDYSSLILSVRSFK